MRERRSWMVVALAAMASLLASVDASIPAHLAEFSTACAAIAEILCELEAISAALDSGVACSRVGKGESQDEKERRSRDRALSAPQPQEMSSEFFSICEALKLTMSSLLAIISLCADIVR
jgi:hypothetical protein